MTEDHWDNDAKITFRTKIALRVLLLMFKILSPYRFNHDFKEFVDALEKDIGKIGEQ